MKLKHIDRRDSLVPLWNNTGYTTTNTYRCPCAKGKVIEEIDDIVGRRGRNVWIECSDCNTRYTVEKDSNGTTWEVIEKKE